MEREWIGFSGPRLVANRVIVNEVKAAIIVLATTHELRGCLRGFGIELSGRVKRIEREERCRQVRFDQWRHDHVRRGLLWEHATIAPAAVLFLPLLPAELL